MYYKVHYQTFLNSEISEVQKVLFGNKYVDMFSIKTKSTIKFKFCGDEKDLRELIAQIISSRCRGKILKIKKKRGLFK